MLLKALDEVSLYIQSNLSRSLLTRPFYTNPWVLFPLTERLQSSFVLFSWKVVKVHSFLCLCLKNAL